MVTSTLDIVNGIMLPMRTANDDRQGAYDMLYW